MRKIFTTMTAFMMVLFSGAMLTACDEEPILYTITYNQSEDYTVTLNKTEAQAGESVEVTIDTGYTIVSVYANNSECDKGEGNTYTFIMPAEDVSLTIELNKNVDLDGTLDITKGNIYIKDLWLEDMAGERITIDNFKPSYINDTFTLPSITLEQESYTINMEIINLTESRYLINIESDDINVEAHMLTLSLSPNDQDLDGLTQESNGEILIAELCAYATNVDLSALTISFMSF